MTSRGPVRAKLDSSVRIFVVECGGVWWSVVECGGVWWSVVECGGVWWSVVECGGVWWSVVEGGCVMTSLINIRHNYMQWRHADVFKHDQAKLADYAFFSVSPRVWYNRGINLGLLLLVVWFNERLYKIYKRLVTSIVYILTTLLLEVFWQVAEIYLVGRINVYWLLEDKVFLRRNMAQQHRENMW
jgi:hypothetical protein